MDPNETFGAWLRRRRRFMDMTQEQLANCAGCSLVTIRKFEADERRPSRQLAELLADCLGVPAAEREAFVTFARQREDGAAARGGSLPVAVGLAAPSVTPPVVSPPEAMPIPEVAAPVVLPTPLTGLLGRVADVAAVGDLLLSTGVRLVTLTGPGGAGKTRLAIEVARQLAARHAAHFPDGIFFVDLAALRDPALFVPAVHEALGLAAGNIEPRAALRAYLRPRRMLLVLDNFEQITAAADELAGVLQAAGGVAALVTSRALLHIYGEHEYQVDPLAAPPAGLALDEFMTYPAVTLFIERSRAVRPGFVLDAANAAAVRQLIARLDGLPLAIELAAARSRLFAPTALLAQLTGALDLAARQQRDARQRTMRAAIDWSYALLTEEEQRFFRALGVFAGGFGPDEAGRLLGEAAGPNVTLDLLTGLVEKSMIRPEESGEPRFRMLAVLREYAVEHLAARGELADARRAHAAYCLDLAQLFGPQMTTAGHGAARAALLVANDDLRAALAWTFETPATAETGLRIALALTDFWIQRGMAFEGQAWLGQGLAVWPEQGGALRPRALIAAGRLAYYQGHFPEAVAFGRAALGLLEGLPDAEEQWTIVALRVVGNASADAGEYDSALHHQNRILELYRRRDNPVGVAQTLQALGVTLVDMGHFDDAIARLTEAVDLFRRHPGDADDLMFSLNALGMAELIRGDYGTAGPALEEALALARGLEAPMWQAMVLNNLGHRAIPLGLYEAARAHFEEGGRLARESKSDQFYFQSALGLATLALMEGAPPPAAWPHVRDCLTYYYTHDPTPNRYLRFSDMLALFAARAGNGPLAARLLSRAAALRREPFRQARFANLQPVFERTLALIRQVLTEDDQETAVGQGEMTPEAVLLAEVEHIGKGMIGATPT